MSSETPTPDPEKWYRINEVTAADVRAYLRQVRAENRRLRAALLAIRALWLDTDETDAAAVAEAYQKADALAGAALQPPAPPAGPGPLGGGA